MRVRQIATWVSPGGPTTRLHYMHIPNVHLRERQAKSMTRTQTHITTMHQHKDLGSPDSLHSLRHARTFSVLPAAPVGEPPSYPPRLRRSHLHHHANIPARPHMCTPPIYAVRWAQARWPTPVRQRRAVILKLATSRGVIAGGQQRRGRARRRRSLPARWPSPPSRAPAPRSRPAPSAPPRPWGRGRGC